MMERGQPLLHVGPRPHFFRGADQDADSPGVHSIEQCFLLGVAVGVVDEGDLGLRHACFNQFYADLVVDVETRRVRRREVAEHELG